MFTIELTLEVENRLGRLAEATGETKTFHALQAIALYLDDLEDFYIAEQRLRDIRDGVSNPIPLTDLNFKL
ncbi:CopG family transcriptional regulator [Pseudomonas syringae]|uniref:CopG family transcriptional regulator n=1 Tax=Pseudomonas syringae TaxID=317 RepID=A0A085V9L3_PSESX|nr:CopG family transcriptional regulator [Pseudomonas syringae]KFE52126.1 CopG family transcriptional regulator [Pseudomonas syringae]